MSFQIWKFCIWANIYRYRGACIWSFIQILADCAFLLKLCFDAIRNTLHIKSTYFWQSLLLYKMYKFGLTPWIRKNILILIWSKRFYDPFDLSFKVTKFGIICNAEKHLFLFLELYHNLTTLLLRKSHFVLLRIYVKILHYCITTNYNNNNKWYNRASGYNKCHIHQQRILWV